MLDGLLHRNNFRTKCKSALTRTKTRLDVIKKKRNAMHKFLKKDVADLLKSKHDRNAYGRADGLYNELNLSSCYDYVDQCCACVSEHLKEMHKERECPEECKVAVSSLVYAAARFADLPELRDLRLQFNEKYGRLVEPYVCKEFVEKLKPRAPSMEMKLQLMQEIAQEYSITWDSLPLQQQLHTLSINSQEKPKVLTPKKEGEKMLRSMSTLGKPKGRQEDCNSPLSSGEQTEKLRTRRHNSYTGFNEEVSDKLLEYKSVQDEVMETSSRDDEGSNHSRRPFTDRIVPPPCTLTENDSSHGGYRKDEGLASYSKEDTNPNLRNIRTKVDVHRQKERNEEAKPRPRSVRTKFSRQSTSSSTSSCEIEKESKSAPVPEVTKHDVFSDDDEEEEDVMRLSMRYRAKKPPKTPSSARNLSFQASPDKEDNATPKSALPLPPGKRRYLFADSQPDSPREAAADRQTNPETPSTTGRSKFLPPDFQAPESPVGQTFSPIRHVKSDSILSDGSFKHVHPKLPDFDELAERIAALRKV